MDERCVAPLVGATESTDLANVGSALESLERECLVQRDGGSLTLHDAVAAFAQTMAQREDPRSQQVVALRRLAQAWVVWVRDIVDEERLDELIRLRQQIVAIASLAPEWDTADETRELSRLIGLRFSDAGYQLEAEALHRSAIECGEPGVAAARVLLGRSLELQGRYREAHEQLSLAYDPNQPDAERALNAMGNILKRLGRLDEALDTYRRSAELAQERGNKWTEGRARGNFADTIRFQGDPEGALPLYAEAIAISSEVDDDVNVALVNSNMAIAAWDMQRYDEALERIEKSIQLASAARYEAGVPGFLSYKATILQSAGRHAEAAEVREIAERVAQAAGQPDVQCDLLMQSGIAAVVNGPEDHERAREIFKRVIAFSRELANPLYECTALIHLADISNDQVMAYQYLTEAAKIADSMGLEPERRQITDRLMTNASTLRLP